ncbi:MAG: ribosomal-protein-alanine N-acetyltransferase, partial [Oceanospirillaceae bacterium]
VRRLLNGSSFIDNIGDKQVRSIDDAVNYLKNGPILSYQQHGFGLNLIILKPLVNLLACAD